jgi:hypothetical protein
MFCRCLRKQLAEFVRRRKLNVNYKFGRPSAVMDDMFRGREEDIPPLKHYDEPGKITDADQVQWLRDLPPDRDAVLKIKRRIEVSHLH